MTFFYQKSPLIGDKCMQLFPDSEMIARKSTSQDDFENSIRGEPAEKIVKACINGVHKARATICSTPPSFQNRNFKANILNSYIQGFLIQEFPNEFVQYKSGRYCLTIEGHRLFCKKIDKRYRHANIMTKTVIMYNDQKSNSKADLLPITYIGYMVSPSYTELLGVYAVHMSGGNIEWISDFYDLACSNTISENFINEDSETEILVTPKKEVAIRLAE